MEDRIGLVFGELAIVGIGGIDKFGKRLYICQCSCGNTKEATFSHLNNGYIKSCGHLKQIAPNFYDLTERRFGKLVAKERIKSKKSGCATKWKCLCDCGNHAVKTTNKLMSGLATKCRDCENRVVDMDLTNKRFGKLEVIEFVECKQYKNFWKCKCDCGNTVITDSYHILYRNKGCGCTLWQGYGEISRVFYTSKKGDAKERGIEFNVDIEYLWNLFINQNRRCALSGVELYFKNYGYKKYNEEQTASIDRIDSQIGYIEGNVQWVHKQINFMKQVLSQQEFVKWCNLVANHNRV